MSNVTTIQKWGNTRAVRIPKALAKDAGFELGTQVTLTPTKDGVVLKLFRTKKQYRLSELLAQCKGRNPHREMLTGRTGKEIF